MKKKRADTRKPTAMVRISPETHRRMRAHLEESGLVQNSFVDRAILAALPGKAAKRPSKRKGAAVSAE
jgi:predicted HicB family RNase H-like nuclease